MKYAVEEVRCPYCQHFLCYTMLDGTVKAHFRCRHCKYEFIYSTPLPVQIPERSARTFLFQDRGFSGRTVEDILGALTIQYAIGDQRVFLWSDVQKIIAPPS